MRSERIVRQIERLLDEAEAALQQSKWDVVRDRAQNVLRLDPDNQDGRIYLAAADRDPGQAPPTAAAPVGAQDPVPSAGSPLAPGGREGEGGEHSNG